LGGGENGLGYSGLPNSLAIEFDTVKNLPGDFDMGSRSDPNDTRSDPNDNHISVQSRGKDANSANTDFSLGFTSQMEPAISLFTLGRHTTKIVYKPGDSGNPGNIAIYLDNMETPVLNANVNLEELLSLDEGKAWVGFTAATSRRSQTHDVLSFSFVGTKDETPNNFNAQLGGDQEVPPRTTEATGRATLQLIDETRLDFTLNLPNIKNFVAAHIHCAPAGENGPIGVTLYGPLAPGGG
jgi:hypothetical protein